MSLDFEQFVRACEEGERLRAKATELFGFSPITSNHYGCFHLYNTRVTSATPDEALLKIRADYLVWKQRIADTLEENGLTVTPEELNLLFDVSMMYGTLKFLDVYIDVYGDFEPFREAIVKYKEQIPRLIQQRKRED